RRLLRDDDKLFGGSMSAQAHVRESESSSGSFISWQFLVWQVMFVIGVVAGMNLEHAFNFLG
ncbi:hypothetical protein AB8F80_23695, partial [Salmonella enterica]